MFEIKFVISLLLLVILVTVGCYISYNLGYKSEYLIVKEKYIKRVINTYSFLHIALLAIFAFLVWLIILYILINGNFNNSSFKENSVIALFSLYFILSFFPRPYFVKGNTARYNYEKKNNLQPVIVDRNDIKKLIYIFVSDGNIVYLNKNLKQKVLDQSIQLDNRQYR